MDSQFVVRVYICVSVCLLCTVSYTVLSYYYSIGTSNIMSSVLNVRILLITSNSPYLYTSLCVERVVFILHN